MNIFVIIKSSQFDIDLVTHVQGAFTSKQEAEDKFEELIKEAITDFHQSGITPAQTFEFSNFFRIRGEKPEQFVEVLLEETALTEKT